MTAKRRAPRRSARSRQRRLQVPKHLFHRLLRTVRTVMQPGRHVTGQKSVSGRTRPNPWPRCPACFHRVPVLCPREGCIVCSGCCPGHDDDRKESTDVQ